jgi:hypothetical protein
LKFELKITNYYPFGPPGGAANPPAGGAANPPAGGAAVKGVYTDGLGKFWRAYGEEITKNAITSLDERAKYMITTCAGLIVINYGLLFAFPGSNINISPQLIFLVSIILFAFSYFPKSKVFYLSIPNTIQSAFQSTVNWKVSFQKWAFVAFFGGLLALGITNLIDDENADDKKDEGLTTTFKGINLTLDNISGSLSGGNITLPKISP